ncbi:hypothetical protein CE91St43_11260 [Oscillospiraceae bacterium]|nr:hypothetical protein CE91St43_11260 [Oscillospiraceae bacterium]
MMRERWNRSFRRKLLFGFLVTGIVPLLICVLMMVGVFRGSLERNAAETAQTQLAAAGADMDELFHVCAGVMDTLAQDPQVRAALSGSREVEEQDIYYQLYAGAAPALSRADVSLFDAHGRRLYSTANDRGGTALSADWGVLRAARETGELVFRDVEDFSGGGPDCLRAARPVTEGGRVLGYVVLEMTDRQFQSLLEGKYGATSSLLVLDPYWSLVYATPSARKTGLVPRLREQMLSGQVLSDKGGEYSYYIRQSEGTGLYLLMQQPKPLAAWIMRLLYLVALMAIALCVGLCVLVSMGFSKQLFEPIRALNSAMSEVERGNLEVQVASERIDEMGQLAGRFDRMVSTLRDNLAESVRQQRDLGDAQIRMLQAQLNPHFLYNTLDTIKWMGKINQVPEVATISADLADILRCSITDQEFVTLEQELRLLDRYVEIQKIRFSGKFQFRTQVDGAMLDVLVPKLMLQPLVENAIVHGFEDREGGEILITARRQGEELEVTVRDDGRGMSEESIRRFQAQTTASGGGHLGLYNVDAILRLHYGADHGLEFPFTGGRGTCVRIRLPISRAGKEREEEPC